MLVACMQMLDMDSNEFNFVTSAWMKSDSDRRSEILDFCQALISKHADFWYSIVGERSEDDITNYVNNTSQASRTYLLQLQRCH